MNTIVEVAPWWYVTARDVHFGDLFFFFLVAALQSPCCGKVYPCRFCHNENEPTHEFNRFAVSEVVCRNCNTRQPVCYTAEVFTAFQQQSHRSRRLSLARAAGLSLDGISAAFVACTTMRIKGSTTVRSADYAGMINPFCSSPVMMTGY